MSVYHQGHISLLYKTFVFNGFFFFLRFLNSKLNSKVEWTYKFWQKEEKVNFCLHTISASTVPNLLDFPSPSYWSTGSKTRVDIYSLSEFDISISRHMHKSLVLWNLCHGQATVASCLKMTSITFMANFISIISKRFKDDFLVFFSWLNKINC